MNRVLLAMLTVLCFALPATAVELSSSTKVDLSKAKPFFVHLCQLSKQGAEKSWGEQLSERKRRKGDKYIKFHFKIWSAALLKYVKEKFNGDPTKADVTLVPRGQKRFKLKVTNARPPLGITVIQQDGRLRIDEN